MENSKVFICPSSIIEHYRPHIKKRSFDINVEFTILTNISKVSPMMGEVIKNTINDLFYEICMRN